MSFLLIIKEGANRITFSPALKRITPSEAASFKIVSTFQYLFFTNTNPISNPLPRISLNNLKR